MRSDEFSLPAELRLRYIEVLADERTPEAVRLAAERYVPVVAKTLPRVELGEYGLYGCWRWLSGIACNNQPSIRIQGRRHSIRRLLWEELHGRRLGKYVVRVQCEDPLCVSPWCLRRVSKSELMRRAWDEGKFTAERARKMALTKRAQGVLTAEQVQEIRTSKLSVRKMAAKLGCCTAAYVQLVRVGRSWKDYGPRSEGAT